SRARSSSAPRPSPSRNTPTRAPSSVASAPARRPRSCSRGSEGLERFSVKFTSARFYPLSLERGVRAVNHRRHRGRGGRTEDLKFQLSNEILCAVSVSLRLTFTRHTLK